MNRETREASQARGTLAPDQPAARRERSEASPASAILPPKDGPLSSPVLLRARQPVAASAAGEGGWAAGSNSAAAPSAGLVSPGPGVARAGRAGPARERFPGSAGGCAPRDAAISPGLESGPCCVVNRSSSVVSGCGPMDCGGVPVAHHPGTAQTHVHLNTNGPGSQIMGVADVRDKRGVEPSPTLGTYGDFPWSAALVPGSRTRCHYEGEPCHEETSVSTRGAEAPRLSSV